MLSVGPRTAVPRHRTLRAAIEWSYALLSERERIAQRLISDEDVERARTERRTDLPGQPLVWREALCRMMFERVGKRCA